MASSAMVDIGFERRSPEFFTWPVSNDFWGTVALSKSIEQGDGLLRIIPQIGVGSAAIQEVTNDLTQCRGYAPNIIKQLG
jgi:hypothetical protein